MSEDYDVLYAYFLQYNAAKLISNFREINLYRGMILEKIKEIKQDEYEVGYEIGYAQGLEDGRANPDTSTAGGV